MSVTGPKEAHEKIKKAVEDTLNPMLDALNLSLNEGKTKVEVFRKKRTGLSSKLKSIQQTVSGPMSLNDVDEQLGHLDGLITLAEGLDAKDELKDNNNPLALIDTPFVDIRSDTLMRFSANKIHRLLNQKRSLCSQEVDESGNVIPGQWDYLQEHMARRFISVWSKNPSLVLLLKKAFELYPHPRILKPVLDQLKLIIVRTMPKPKAVAEYCLCEIFRHAATYIHRKDDWAIPAHADREAFFELLQEFAIQLHGAEYGNNEYLAKQVRFFLLIRNDSTLGRGPGDRLIDFTTRFMKGFRNVTTLIDQQEFISCSLLAYQIANDKKAVIRSVSSLLEKASQTPSFKTRQLNQSDIPPISKMLARESLELFTELQTHAKNCGMKWIQVLSGYEWLEELALEQTAISGELTRFNGKPVSLLGVTRRADNPFAHENAVLKLVLELLKNEVPLIGCLSLADAKVTCDDWGQIQHPETKIELEMEGMPSALYRTPKWITEEHKPLYIIGSFIRSCLLANPDWSNSRALTTEFTGYRGLKTSFYKRQLGMSHAPETFNDCHAPMTNWLSSLLYRLLQWPGMGLDSHHLHSWPKEWNLSTLKGVIEKRLRHQLQLFCVSSGIPGYVEKIGFDWPKDKKHLNVVMVQSLMPKQSDFSKHGLCLDTPQYRANHRRHFAAIAQLVMHKAYGHNSTNDKKHLEKPDIDLIIWPELSVHIDDIDILERLSDKTGAMIFAGMGFTNLPNQKGPINVAQWVIPSYSSRGRQFIKRLQGKKHMTRGEKVLKIQPWRPYHAD